MVGSRIHKLLGQLSVVAAGEMVADGIQEVFTAMVRAWTFIPKLSQEAIRKFWAKE